MVNYIANSNITGLIKHELLIPKIDIIIVYFYSRKMECPVCLENWSDVSGIIHILCYDRPHSICYDCQSQLNTGVCVICRSKYSVECKIISAYGDRNQLILTNTDQKNQAIKLIDTNFPKVPWISDETTFSLKGRTYNKIPADAKTIYLMNSSLNFVTDKTFRQIKFLSQLILTFILKDFKSQSMYSSVNRGKGSSAPLNRSPRFH